MKLVRFGDKDDEKPGVLLANEERVDVSAFGEDFGETFFARGGPSRLAAWLESRAGSCPRVASGVRWASPVVRPSKIVCVGLNYQGHAAEQGISPPSEPMLFTKASTALSGPFDPLPLPRDSTKTDWEVELALVIGKRARYVEKSEALDFIAGFALLNDYSEREHQRERGGQFVKGKSHDGFAPLGPWLATPDEIDHAFTSLTLRVNGAVMQAGSTTDLIFDVPTLVSHISSFMTLLPGDIISTGTPAGVGMSRKPPRFLAVGDIVEYEAEGLGLARQVVVAPV